ncbi:hypothetical protein ACF0H5_019155 [Mactra antiquata]
MGLNAFLWLVLGIALQFQILVADSTNSNKINPDKPIGTELKNPSKASQGDVKDNGISYLGRLTANGNSVGDLDHILTKRYTDLDDGYEPAARDDSINGIGLNGLYPLDSYGYFNGYGTDGVDESDFSDNLVDKRHNSRWSLIHRKLAELNGNNKRDYDKRQASRWLIIQNKLNQLHNKYSKRGIGRWKNTNWALGQLQNQ